MDRLKKSLIKPNLYETGSSKKRISDHLCGMINDQIDLEFNSFLVYNAMSNYFGYNGMMNGFELFKKYAHEELGHMHIFQDFLLDRNDLPCGCLEVDPVVDFTDPCDIVKKALEHEIKISTSLKGIAKAAMDEADFMTYELMLKMIKEQVEEEAKFETILDKVEMYKNSDSLNYFIEEEFKSNL